ncbi:MAG: hypothetical protein HYR62_03945 [Actinobacteria bacterium]|nr:hypothetical protein [Actinomycetota bacterium]
MSDALNVDPAGLRRAAATLAGTGRALAGEFHDCTGVLAARGSPWGSDDAGTGFGVGYLELTGLAVDACRALTAGLADLADRLTATAEAAERADQDATTALHDASDRGFATPG